MIPYGEMPNWGKIARFLIDKKTETQTWCFKKLKKPSSGENWQQQVANELHKLIKCNFTRRRIIGNGVNGIWCSDLVETQQFSKWNGG